MQSQWHRHAPLWQVQPPRSTHLELEDAIRCARTAQEQLAIAQHNFARENEQLHTTIAALEYSSQNHRRHVEKLNAEILSLRSQNQSLGVAKNASDERCSQTAAELKRTRDDRKNQADQLQLLIDQSQSEVKRLEVTVAKLKKRDRKRQQSIAESDEKIAELSGLVRILRTDHEYGEFVIADLDHLCAAQEMVLADLRRAADQPSDLPSAPTECVDDLLGRYAACETELEHRTLQLQLAEERLDDQAHQIAQFQEQNRTLQTRLRHSEADLSIAASEAQLQYADELKQIQGEWESEQAKWSAERIQWSSERARLTDPSQDAGTASASDPIEISSLKATMARLTNELHEKDSELQRTQVQCQLQQESLVESSKELDTSERLAAKLQTKLENQFDQIAQQAHQIEQLQSDDQQASTLIPDSDDNEGSVAQWEKRIDQLESELIRSRYQSGELSKQLEAQANQFLRQATTLKRARDLALQNSQSQAQRAAEFENQLSALRKETSRQINESTQRLETAEQEINRLTDLLAAASSDSQSGRRAA